MKCAVLTLLLVASTAFCGPHIGGGGRAGPRQSGKGTSSGSTPAPFLAFAPLNGVGMTGLCTGVTPTGTNGELLTFTRPSGATCLKSASQNTGIQPGDMVSVTANQPRIVIGPLGAKGLQRENDGDNTTWWSEGIDHAALWSDFTAGGAAAPTITADQAQGPDGGMWMDEIAMPATSSSQSSGRQEIGGCLTSTTLGASAFFQGKSTAGATYIAVRTSSGPTYSCQSCPYVADSLTRCQLENVTATNAGDIMVGNLGSICGGVSMGAADFFVGGFQCEASGGDVTSYMPAPVSADGVRAFEVADFPAALSGLSGLSMSSWFLANSPVFHAGGTAVTLVLGDGTIGATAAPTTYVWMYSAVAQGRLAVDTLGVASAGATSEDLFYAQFDGGTPAQTAIYHTGSFLNTCQEGICAAVQANPGIASTFGTPTFTRLILGRQSGAAIRGFNGIINQVCLDRTTSQLCVPKPAVGSRVWIGDSIVYGTGSIPQTPYVQLTRLAGHTIQGAGVGSNTISQCTARWESTYRPAAYTTLLWSCAVNSAAAGQTGATMASAAEVVFAEAAAQGMRVIATGIMPWKNSSGWTLSANTEGLAYNAAIQAYLGAHGGTYIDTSSMGGQGGDPDVLLTIYNSGDNIHPNVAGAGVLATLVNAASPRRAPVLRPAFRNSHFRHRMRHHEEISPAVGHVGFGGRLRARGA